MKNALYWTALVIGIIIMVWIVKPTTSVENFQATTSSPATTPATAATTVTAAPVINEVANSSTFASQFVATTNIFSYVSAFSNKTTRNNVDLDSYNVATTSWLDLVQNNDFFIKPKSGTVPSTLTDATTNWKGLPMTNVALIGPRSEFMSVDPNVNNYELPSFSVSFYMKWNSLDALQDDDIILFQMFAENPNFVCWKISEDDDVNVTMKVILGNATTIFKWTIPISTLISNGQPTLYTLTYDKTSKEVKVYIGVISEYKKTLSSITPIYLANTPMSINANGNMDAVVSAICVFKNYVLTTADLQKLNAYFMNKAGGADVVLAQAQSRIQEATVQNEELQSKLSNTQSTITDLQNKLKTCQASVPVSTQPSYNPVAKFSKWMIKEDGVADLSKVPASSLTKCSALDISDFGDAASTSPFKKQVTPEIAAEYSPVKPFKDYDIVNPANSKTSVATTPTPTPTSTPTPAASTATATTSASPTTTSPTASTPSTTAASSTSAPATDADFWKGLFNFVVNNKNDTTQFDKTKPGLGATLVPDAKATDVAKTEDTKTPPPVQEKSLWAFITDMF